MLNAPLLTAAVDAGADLVEFDVGTGLMLGHSAEEMPDDPASLDDVPHESELLEHTHRDVELTFATIDQEQVGRVREALARVRPSGIWPFV